jgi:hypothetical protein
MKGSAQGSWRGASGAAPGGLSVESKAKKEMWFILGGCSAATAADHVAQSSVVTVRP